MPPIYDQGHLGSCTANAVAAAQTIAFGFAVFSGFVSDEVKNTGIVPPPDPSQIIPNEGHEVLAVGYLEDHPQHCLCQNSWVTSGEWTATF